MVKKLKNEKKKGPNKFLIIMLIFLISFVGSFGAKVISYKSYQESTVDNGLDTKEMPYTKFISELESNNVENDNLIYSEEVFGDIVMLLGGKAAESIMSGSSEKISLGSDKDINIATQLAMGCVKFKSGIDYRQFGDSGIAELMKEAKKVLDDANEKAIDTVTSFKEKIELISRELIKNENISGDVFLELVA